MKKFLLGIFFSSVLLALDPAPKLLDIQTGKVLPGSELLPNRVYAVYNSSKKGWYYALTNAFAKFASPVEALYPGSVLPSEMLGGKNSLEKFTLTAKQTWEKTPLKTQWIYLVWDEVPYLKRVRHVK